MNVWAITKCHTWLARKCVRTHLSISACRSFVWHLLFLFLLQFLVSCLCKSQRVASCSVVPCVWLSEAECIVKILHMVIWMLLVLLKCEGEGAGRSTRVPSSNVFLVVAVVGCVAKTNCSLVVCGFAKSGKIVTRATVCFLGVPWEC